MFDDFTHSGRLELNVSHISFSFAVPDSKLGSSDSSSAPADSWFQVLKQLEDAEISCTLQSDLIKKIFTFDKFQEPAAAIGTHHGRSIGHLPEGNHAIYSDCLDWHWVVFSEALPAGQGEEGLDDSDSTSGCGKHCSGVVVDENGPFGQDEIAWKQVFLLVDVICCCAVLFPIVWSIKNLREAARTAVNLMKLTLFRQYYIVVICYIYFTRVVVFVLETITSYKYLWTSVVAAELATLAFYIFTGYKFMPEAHNPYFAIDDEEEEAAAEVLNLDDEFEL
ncbi:hypothetical protein SAY87_025563 [Trapa incisa]|uniref:GOST seven transmembrane domain-containing protein n=1 Tax=Trapa incisa TaxID=236973 RepID=A0AAN7GG09_9MYRT|nr:hypothetical protein SAY87_025563 [Trapa incisa]